MNNKFTLYVFVTIGLFVTSLITIFILEKYASQNVIAAIAIPISILNIFATGYGAYLGAKISGENSVKMMKEELVMSDLIDKNKNNILLLNEFDNIVNKYNLLSKADITNFINKLNSSYLVKKDFNYIEEILLDSSQVISFPIKNYIDNFIYTYHSYSLLEAKLNEKVSNYIKNKLNTNERVITEITFLGVSDLLHIIFRENESKFVPVKYELLDNNLMVIKESKVEVDCQDVFDNITLSMKSDINRYIDAYNECINSLIELKFKNTRDLENYITNYYK